MGAFTIPPVLRVVFFLKNQITRPMEVNNKTGFTMLKYLVIHQW